jgi:hypothetical protein
MRPGCQIVALETAAEETYSVFMTSGDSNPLLTHSMGLCYHTHMPRLRKFSGLAGSWTVAGTTPVFS